MRIRLDRHADSLSGVVYGGAGFAAVFVGIYAMVLVAVITPGPAYADDAATAATAMSNQAFGLLNGLNAESNGGNANPLLGPIASFAGDADTLSHVLKGGDKAAAAQALGALENDRAAVDAAIAAHPKAISAGAWASLTNQLDALAKQVPPPAGSAASPAAATTSATAPSAATSDVPAGGVTTAPLASTMAGPAPSSDGAAPRVIVDSRVEKDDIVTIKGYFEGTGLKSAGIYEDGQALRSFKVDNVPGEQRVNFTLGLEHPRANTVLRVADAHGRSAEAPVLELATAAATDSGAPSAAAPPTETLADMPPPSSSEPPLEVLRGSPSSGGHGDTAVIPSHGPIRPSPSKRHTIGGHLGSVQINIIGTTELSTSPPSYEVIGQIAGHGITRAGIYVDGRLVKRIPVTEGGDFSSFDQRFVMNGGEASIRAYGVGDQYVENSIDVTGNGVAMAAPPAMMPVGMAIQITTLRQVAANLYLVSGVISGRSIASAGLYQNGMLMQTIPLHSSLLGAIIPGASQQIAFNVRFNPSLGAALIRAFDTAGAHTDQPVMVAGTNPYGYGVNPYATNPYGTSGYGVNPYAPNPYGASPVNPYLPPTNPYATSPYGYRGAPSRPLW